MPFIHPKIQVSETLHNTNYYVLSLVGCPFSKYGNKHVEERFDREEDIADAQTTTPNECTCTSLCESSIGAGIFRYDWCHTNEGCGEYNFYTGYWDKCQYLDRTKPNYIALSWEDKHKQMWANIVSDNALAPFPNAAKLLSESVQTTFDDEWDVMPAGRKKFIHPVGAVCPFVVNIADSPFTGILKTGESRGLIRLGSAAAIEDGAGVTPGGGVKFFRSGISSANFVILNQLGPIADKNCNFFSVPLFNHIPDNVALKLIPAALKFCQAQSCPTKVGLSDLCTYDQEGNKSEDVVFPFKVSLD